PTGGADELYSLSHVTRFSPITHEGVLATSSIFVSAGRFSFYLILLWILVFGALGYLLLSRRSTKYALLAIGIATVAVLGSGTRTPFVFVLGSGLVMTAPFLGGGPG